MTRLTGTTTITQDTDARVTGITVRRRTFDYQGVSRYFFDDNPMLSYLLIALSSTFPEGERFFVHSVRQVRDQVQDPRLQQDISGFIGQEAMHSRAHEGFNNFAQALGVDVSAIVAEEKRVIEQVKARLNPRQQLAVTCALEHFTAMIATHLLRHPDYLDGLHPVARELWLWHALEEAEHKAVAFDVYQAVFADEAVRKRVMRIVTMTFLSRISYLTARLLLTDTAGRRQIRRNLSGLRRTGKLVWALRHDYLRYYRDGFHPGEDDTQALTRDWAARLATPMAA